MNLFFSILVSLFMAASSTPTNPVIAELLQKANAQSDAPTMIYESNDAGNAIIILQSVPVSGQQLRQMPIEMVKPAIISEMKNVQGEERALLDELKKDNISLIVRLTATDGTTVDVKFTPADF